MEFIDKKQWVRGLIFRCPRGTPIDVCPLKEIRLLPQNESFEMINSMSDSVLEDIITHHERCYSEVNFDN